MPRCKRCNKNCATDRGFQQHLQSKPLCMVFHQQTLGFATSEPRFDFPVRQATDECIPSPKKRKKTTTDKSAFAIPAWWKSRADNPTPAAVGKEDGEFERASKRTAYEQELDDDEEDPVFDYEEENDEPLPLPDENEDSDEANIAPTEPNVDIPVANLEATEPDHNHDQVVIQSNETSIRDQFRAYCEEAPKNKLPFLTKKQEQGIRLLDLLRKKKAPMDTYSEVMLWHYQSSGKLAPNEKLKDSNDYVGREVLVKQLKERYRMANKFPSIKTRVLPYSGTKVNLVCYDAAGCIEALLTDPRLQDSDYLFWDDDPRATPPANFSVFGDINTGRAYKEAVKKYKKDANHVVLPIIMYIDGSNTGQMKDMPITALKMTLGIFKRSYRDQPHAWRVLGSVTSVTKNMSKARKRLRKARHIASTSVQIADREGVEQVPDASDGTIASGDLHAMLDTILESYRELQTKGILWDLRYKGKTWRDLVLIPFLILMKCDTKEGDLLCGSYTIYTGGVQQLCRYCCCPTEDTDNPQARYDLKTVPMLKRLVQAREKSALRSLAQQCVMNAFWKVRFSPCNDRGIHGACPSELLHALLLGMMMYTRDTLYEQIGIKSEAAKEIDEQSQLFGMQFGRQSERRMPNCRFTNGVREGKLNAKEYPGVLLVLAAILHSTDGKYSLRNHRYFKSGELEDWTYLLEIVLAWWAFLTQPEISAQLVGKLGLRNRLIMWYFKKTCFREQGMGLKLMKYHAITHMVMDIYNFGVPSNFDTGSDESGHKVTKVAAKMTQKNQVSFEFQTATRESEFHVIDLAMQELSGNKLWDYYNKEATESVSDAAIGHNDISTGETTINIMNDCHGKPAYSIGTGPKSRSPSSHIWNKAVVKFLHELQEKVGKWMNGKLQIKSDHRRMGKVYRGHPNFRSTGEAWKDWAIVDWGEEVGQLPSQIWCFIILENLPTSEKKKSKHKERLYHGNCHLESGTYVVLERARLIPRPHTWNANPEMLFKRIQLEMAGSTRSFFLAKTEAIVEPCFIIPDFGSEDKRSYFQIANRDKWADIFSHWMDLPVPPAYQNDQEGRRFHS